jgi:hypothetical protein
MRNVGFCFMVVGAAICGVTQSHAQQTITITSTQQQSNFNGGIGAGQTAVITASPFNFSNQPQLISIDSITITLTVFDGDTGLGPNGINETPWPPPGDGTFGDDDFDVNSFSLVLDNINLGQYFLLNGLDSKADPEEPPSQADFVTRTITGTPNDMNALLLALQDGFLSAGIYDSTGDPQSNGIVIPGHDFNSPNPIFATLSFTGTAAAIPEPSSESLLLGASLLGAAFLFWRRRRAADPDPHLHPAFCPSENFLTPTLPTNPRNHENETCLHNVPGCSYRRDRLRDNRS